MTKDKTHFKALLATGDAFLAGTNRKMYPVDSVWLDTASTLRRCYFNYIGKSGDEERSDVSEMVVPCWEFYFEEPHTMDGDFFVGRSWLDWYYDSVKTKYYIFWDFFGRYDILTAPHNFAYKHFRTTHESYHLEDLKYDNFCWWNGYDAGVGEACQSNGTNNIWGYVFPIVGFRCKPLRGVHVGQQGDYYVGLRWLADGEEGAEYAVSIYDTVAHSTVAADTIADTTYTSPQLKPSIYRLSVSKRCHYATSTYDTVVWSDPVVHYVATGGYVPPDPDDTTAGIRMAAVGDADFSLRPNPAGETVEVSLQHAVAQNAELTLMDMQGRTLQRRTLPAGTCTLTLDLTALPSGTYLLKLVTPQGLATRRLLRR